ncbi:MAG: amidophosphoribosyltransferase, partial [Flavobacteriaceae bacterium]
MSDAIKHECGIALIRLLKPLEYYKKKYGTAFYAVNKMYLMMEKQHNRGQDGAGIATIKFDMQPGERYIARVRSAEKQPIQDIFDQINTRIQGVLDDHPDQHEDLDFLKEHIPYLGELMLGHVRYGTFGQNSIENVHPFLRQNNWMHRNLIVAGNFNMTNVQEMFNELVRIGQHPKAMADTVTVMERIGHFLDDAVAKLYKDAKREGYTKREASSIIAERLDVARILRKAAKNWDGGYAMAGLIGHGDAFVLRDPAGIRPAYYYKDDEIVVVASERPAIQTVFNVKKESIHEIEPGQALIVKKAGDFALEQVLEAAEKKACSFERIYFSRGSDEDIYKERKALGKYVFNRVYDAIEGDLFNSVFSYIPNTAETSFLGMISEAQTRLNAFKKSQILAKGDSLSEAELDELLMVRPRIEKVAIKDAKLRTFITQDSSRDDLVAHVYDITYGSVKTTDNLVIIDDSIVRGTTLKKSILRMLDRLHPKQIVVVSSAPQIRYPDCYGIDMARLEDFIAFRAAIELHKERGTEGALKEIYTRCLESLNKEAKLVPNYVKEVYAPFSNEELELKISDLLRPQDMKAPVKIL